MKRNAANYQIKPNPNLNKTPKEQYIIFKNSGTSKGIKYLAFNDDNGKFAIDTGYNSLLLQILISTKIQANLMSSFTYDDYKKTAMPINLTPEINTVIKPPAQIPIAPRIDPIILPPNQNQPSKEGGGGILVALAGIAAFLLL